jgi:general secretion pathway protein G
LLIELLALLVRLGLITGLVGPRITKHLGESKTKTARVQIEELAAALDLVKLEVGRYPTTRQGLKALVEQPEGVEGWAVPYLKKRKLRNDPWDHTSQYRFPGQLSDFDLFSLAPTMPRVAKAGT